MYAYDYFVEDEDEDDDKKIVVTKTKEDNYNDYKEWIESQKI
jgi:hypothetical protein